MPKRSALEKRFRAVAYSAPGTIAVNEFGYEFKRGVIYPKISFPDKILLPQKAEALKNFVLIKVEGCGICGTDIHMYYGKRFFDEKADEGNLMIPGHELFGKVVYAQDDFAFLTDKDVVIDPILDCYEGKKCRFCEIDKNYMHTPFREMGICGGVPGGFAEYAVGLAKNCFETGSLSYKHKSLVEPLATIVHAFRFVLDVKAAPKRYLIIGSGTAGLLALQYLKKLNSANHIVLLDKNDFKLMISKRLGADRMLCSAGMGKDEIVCALSDISGDDGFDYILELSGSDEAISLIPSVASKLAKVLVYGLGHQKVCIEDFDLIVEKEITLYPSLGASNKESFKEAVNAIAGFNADEIITHTYRGLDSIGEAVKDHASGERYVKGVLLI